MGSDKVEKKREKAIYKAEKKRAKLDDERSSKMTREQIKETPRPIIINMPKEPWYKDPRWISAIIGAVTLSLALITIFTDWL